ncbi:MAG: polyribonucleotide nucleotidyltransferase [Eubacteriales bacterium]|nr:polyribonucleotide nucleotidyltransferase [Eubacteriales bacterium]
MEKRTFNYSLNGRDLIIETGQIAQFANGAVLVRYGDTTVLTTVVAAAPREGIDFFPLSVDYEERMYAIGKIPGGFLKREGRPTENAVLTARSIDRPMRPLFPKGFKDDVTISNLVFSVDQDNPPEIAAMLGSSIACSISDIPWNGPTATVQVALIDGEIIVNPNQEQRSASSLDLVVAGTKDKVCMIEAGADEVSDEVMLEAIIAGHKEIQNICAFIEEIVAAVGKSKYAYEVHEVPHEIERKVEEFARDEMRKFVLNENKAERQAAIDELKERMLSSLEPSEEELSDYLEVFSGLEKAVIREYLFAGKRVDGRSMDQIRELSAAVDLIPRVHGSGFFQRGQTQVMTIATLATLGDAERLDGLNTDKTEKRYMHHYNFPAYSVGESRPARSPGRREIGHGALAERSLVPVLPDSAEFPYAIRCVSEITMSNGSTSQGSVCASTLALMAAGVPLKRPVAGISCGLISNPENIDDYQVFMDIQGIEDFFGDMDFKVAGTTEGITGIQVDIKVDGLTYEIIRDAFAMTKKGREQIINEVILKAIDAPREELNPYAPKITQIEIPSDKIREVIGSGGKVIRQITEETGAEIDIHEEGTIGRVYIAAVDSASADKAIKMINTIVFDPEVGQVFDGTVTRLMNFGAFVEFAPGKEGLVHISKMAWEHIDKPEDIVEPGQEVKVVVSEIDSQGRINLSMRDLQEKPEDYRENTRSRERSERPDRRRRNDRGGERGDRGGERNRQRSGGHRRYEDKEQQAKPDVDKNIREF